MLTAEVDLGATENGVVDGTLPALGVVVLGSRCGRVILRIEKRNERTWNEPAGTRRTLERSPRCGGERVTALGTKSCSWGRNLARRYALARSPLRAGACSRYALTRYRSRLTPLVRSRLRRCPFALTRCRGANPLFRVTQARFSARSEKRAPARVPALPSNKRTFVRTFHAPKSVDAASTPRYLHCRPKNRVHAVRGG